jgi:hypothetical protein
VFTGYNTRGEECTIDQNPSNESEFYLADNCPKDSNADETERIVVAVVHSNGELAGFNYRDHEMYIKLEPDYVDPC